MATSNQLLAPRPRLLLAPLAAAFVLALATPLAAEVQLHAVTSDRLQELAAGVSAGRTRSIGAIVRSSSGAGAQTRLEVGQVEQATSGGTLANLVQLGNVMLRAAGRDAEATLVIGRIEGTVVGGSLVNSVSVGSSTDIAIGTGARACTELGTFGRGGCR